MPRAFIDATLIKNCKSFEAHHFSTLCCGVDLRSAQEPAEIGGPSTPPMLPRSGQDDSIFSALALGMTRQADVKAL